MQSFGRLNTITINNWLTKVDFKVLISIPIFGRLIRKKHKQANKPKDYITKLTSSQPTYKAVPLHPRRMTTSNILTDRHTCNALLSLGDFQYSARQAACAPTIVSSASFSSAGQLQNLAADLALWGANWCRK